MAFFRSLYGKLASGLFLLLVLAGLLYATLSLMLVQQQSQGAEQVLNRDLARNLVNEMGLVHDGRVDRVMIEQAFHMAMLINPSIEIYLLAGDGTILAYSADPAKVRRERVDLAPVRRFLADASAYPLRGDDPRSHERHKVFSATAVPDGSGGTHYLYVVLQGEEAAAAAAAATASAFQRLGLTAAAVSLVAALLLGLWLFHTLTRRLHRLSAAVVAFRDSGYRGDGAPRAGVLAGDDEIGQLGTSFTGMAKQIAGQFEALSEQDRLRRELVANVSHDLRTPLAALHGYLETLHHKGARLSEAEREEFLDIALRHSERLARLVGDLFELAKFDAREVTPQREPFPLAELVQDVVQKYALQAQHAGIALDFESAGELPPVVGDIGLIERVLDNLVDNAMGHTPAGGRVTLSLRRAGDGIRLEVADSGEGIPEAELPLLFERFHQVDNAHRGGDHSGLGLAITKRILDLHDAVIDVRSRSGEGTAFCFALPAAKDGG